jgi:hypothetical protein
MRPGLIVKAVSTVVLMLVGWQVGSAIGDGELQPRHALWGMGIERRPASGRRRFWCVASTMRFTKP